MMQNPCCAMMDLICLVAIDPTKEDEISTLPSRLYKYRSLVSKRQTMTNRLQALVLQFFSGDYASIYIPLHWWERDAVMHVFKARISHSLYKMLPYEVREYY